jgi:hypothetical protein
VSVQNCESYPTARGENKQALKNKTASAFCMDVKHINKRNVNEKKCVK